MADRDAIDAGRAAWQRLQRQARATWADWLAVGQALVIGRTEALQKAKTNRPVGTRYNRAMAEWLAENGLSEVSPQERYRCLKVLENLDAIETWRGQLEQAQRRRLNHPGAIWAAWRRSACEAAPHVADAKAAPAGDLLEMIVAAVEARWNSGDPLVIARTIYFAVRERIEPHVVQPRITKPAKQSSSIPAAARA